MSDTISRQQAIDAVAKWMFEVFGIKESDGTATVFKRLRELPPAQPERPKGEWTKDSACPFCGFKPWYERDIHTLSFCPNCGADMRGEEEVKRMRLIDADKIPWTDLSDGKGLCYVTFMEKVNAMPTIELEHKTGQWIPTASGKGRHECSRCHEYAPCYQDGSEHLSTFCVLCGAKMESGGEQE